MQHLEIISSDVSKFLSFHLCTYSPRSALKDHQHLIKFALEQKACCHFIELKLQYLVLMLCRLKLYQKASTIIHTFFYGIQNRRASSSAEAIINVCLCRNYKFTSDKIYLFRCEYATSQNHEWQSFNMLLHIEKRCRLRAKYPPWHTFVELRTQWAGNDT